MNVQGPDGAVIEFPDDLPPEQVKAAMQKKYGAPGLATRMGRAVIAGGKEAAESVPALAESVAGIPKQVATDISNLVGDPSATLREWGGRAARFAPPAVGTAVGGLVGGFPGAVAGGTLGSLGVQAVESGQAPSPEDVVRETTATALVGRAGEVIPRAVKGAVKAGLGPRSVLPGVTKGGAPVFHEIAEPRVNLLSEEFRPTDAAITQAYADLASHGNPPIGTTNLQRAISQKLAAESKLTPELQDAKLVTSLQNMSADAASGNWTLENMIANLRRMGAKLGSTPNDPEGLARLDAETKSNLVKAMHQDINDLGAPYAPALGKADRLWRRSMAADELQGIVDRGKNVVSNQYDRVGINEMLKGIKKQELDAARGIRKAKRFVGSFDPGELDAMKKTLKDIARDLPPIGAARGVAVGSSQRFLGASIGYTLGKAVGDPRLGGAIGVFTPELVSHALMTEPGRAALRFAFHLDPTASTPVFSNTLGAVLRSEAKPDHLDPGLQAAAARATPAPTPQPTPQSTPTAPLVTFDEQAFQKWKGNYADTGATEPELRQTFQAGLSPTKPGVGGPWVPPNVLKNARTEPLGKVLDYWRDLTGPQKQQLRPILMARLLRGQLLPQDRDQLRAALMPNSLPEEAPTH